MRKSSYLNWINILVTGLKKLLRGLRQNPFPSDAKFIGRDPDTNDKIFRYRIGDFRALYKVKEKEKIVLVTRIDKRPCVYK